MLILYLSYRYRKSKLKIYLPNGGFIGDFGVGFRPRLRYSQTGLYSARFKPLQAPLASSSGLGPMMTIPRG